MKLSPSLRKFRKLSLYLASYSLLIIVMLAPVPQIYAAANPSFFRSLPGSISLENGETITEIIINDPSVKLEVRPEEVGSPYSPISSISGTGDAYTIDDNFIYQESHSEDLLLKHTSIQANDYIQANYTVEDLGYSDDYYTYNISSITALKDFYEIEAYTSRTVPYYRDIGYLANYKILAQGFEVKWDNANFTKARLWLQEFITFNDQIDIFLCPIGTDNYPNATNVLSSAGSYSGSGLTSSSIIDGVQILPTYTFSEVTLSKGTYFIVVNYTTYLDGANSVWWWGNNTTPYTGLAYRSLDNNNGTGVSWNDNSWDLTLEVELLPVNSTFDGALTFSDPKVISLRDNSTSIDNNYFTIQNSFGGFHYLKSNTSVSANFDTIYYFSTTYSSSTVYSITNSTFNSMTCDWNITWSSNQISTTYTLLSRNMSLIIPADWTGTFNWYYNLTSPFSFEKSVRTYIAYLNVNTSAGDWWIATSSPNHIYSATFSDSISETDRYILGYWTTDTIDAYGNNGSTINLDAFVRGDDGSVYNDTTGTLNYTLYDPNGLIVPLKSGLDPNISFVDVTSYSLGGLTNSTEGYYSASITFDPSVYGTDLPGFWSAVIHWENGTEVGFYSQRIIVQTNTTFICEWEIEPGSNSWTTSDITREQFDDIDIRAFYYNISEPFFVSNGKAIPSAEVTYTPSWKAGGTFIDSSPNYTATVNADSTVGVRTIDILASGAFLINHTASFDITVFYKLAFDTLNTYYNANYTNNAYFYFALTDVSASSNLTDVSPGSPDDMTVTVDNGTDNFVLSSPADYTFTYTGASELWELDISTSTNDLVVGLYNVFITVQYNDYRANYTDQYVSDVFVLEVSAPKTVIQINSADNSIYTYHTALFNFDFFDTNHSLDLTGAVIDVWFNVSGVSAIVTPIASSYQVEVTNNNPNTIGISVYINVTKPNYVPINNYLLGELNVVIIQTEIVTIDVPADMFDGYNTSVIIQFNDLDNVETIDGAYLESIITNSTNFVNVSIAVLGGGQYNITFINYDVAVFWLDMNITLAKPGYYKAVIRITIKIIVVQTDYTLLDSSSVSIYYDTGTTFNILYWDNVSFVNITDPQVFFSGNLTGVVTPGSSFLNNITTITILTITDLGYYELIITISEPGFEPQVITVYILVQERQTSVDSNETDLTFYADLTDQILLNYTDELDVVAILLATVDIDFAVDNSSLIVQDYFIINLVEVSSFYEITFDPIEINATGYVFVFNMTLSKYGYETSFIIITVTINVHPTAIDPTSSSQDNVYTDEDGEFTIIYETTGDNFIGSAELSYTLINGTSAEIQNVVLSQIVDAYVVYVYFNNSIDPVTSFLINLTFYKYGFENQSWIITLTIIVHPTDIDPSSENQDTIYTDGVGNYTIIYESIENDFIGSAELSYILINGTSSEIQNVALSQILDTYIIDVYINSSIVPAKSFLIELTFYKHGYENQTWIITITIIYRSTAIDPSSASQDNVYTDEDGEFTVIYETTGDTFIGSAELSYTLINGTSAEIENVVLSQIVDAYIVYVYFNSSIVPAKSFLINLTFYKHGYENQTWIITITIIYHPTAIDPSSASQDNVYTDEDGEFTVIYETTGDTFIGGAELSYTLINGTSAEIENVVLSQIVDAYVVYVYFNSSIIPVKSFLINLTFYKHGYANQTWIITITIIYHPTAIDPSSASQDTINTDEDGEFIIIYETIEDDFISGAELTYILINGTSAEIQNVALSQILDTYVISITINSSIVPVTSFLIELTFYKHGFENQTLTVTLIVSIHPTAIDPSSDDQDTIYADEDGEFNIIYETDEGDFISGAEMDYNIVNGTTAEILSVTYSQRTDYYLITVYFDESLIAGKNFSIELTFYKHGYQNQSSTINIYVHPKITYEILLEIVGEVRQLNTIQFQITLSNFSIDLLAALSFENIKFYTNPDGDFALITYTFTFANGTEMVYQIQAEFQQISDGVFVALTSEIMIPWRVTEVSYEVSYTPTSQSVLSIESTDISESVTQNPKFIELLTYLFTEFTPYMAAALAVIAAVFISLTIFFAVIRPRKQRRLAKKKGYLDKISKILTSVISMRKVIVVHNETGLPVYEWDLGGEITVDSTLVTGFLQAVAGMGGEISGGEASAVKKIDYGQFCVTSAGTDCITTYLFSTAEVSKDVEQGIADFVNWFEKRFHDIVTGTWDGKTDVFQENARQIIDTLSENLFIWTLYSLSVNVVKEKEVPKLDQLSQKIFKFIKDYKEVSISVALEYFNKSPIEETLTKLFELVDTTFLLRKRLRK